MELVEFGGQIFSDKYYFITKMRTKVGVSGGPLIMKGDKNEQVIGLHAMSLNEFVDNRAAIKLREEMFEEITNNFKTTLHSYDCGKLGITKHIYAKIKGVC